MLAQARCYRCGLAWQPAGLVGPDPQSQLVNLCGTCLINPPPVSRTCVAIDYQFPWDRLIPAFKFSGQIELARMLAPLLLQTVRDPTAFGSGPLPEVDRICPVPLWHGRLAERGYNQSWELARRVAAALNKPASPELLQRWRATATQSRLDRAARAQNLRGAFMVPHSSAALVAGSHLAVVDDVMTTGSTAYEAAQTLLRNGAASVQLWVLARVAGSEPS